MRRRSAGVRVEPWELEGLPSPELSMKNLAAGLALPRRVPDRQRLHRSIAVARASLAALLRSSLSLEPAIVLLRQVYAGQLD